MLGETLGHYRILERLGAGGMGIVYRAVDEQLEREVAIKVLPAGVLSQESGRSRFRREALTLAKLNHPNIATVFEFGTHGDVNFLVMELIPGRALNELLKCGPLSEEEVLRLGVQFLDGLAVAHDKGVIHRDIKPSNLFLTPDGRLKILDFGLAILLKSQTDEETTEASANLAAAAGTLPYMSPEQLRGGSIDARSDIFAAGIVLYEMATGQRPFPEAQASRIIDGILNKNPTPPTTWNRNISAGLQQIILKALNKDPDHRYQSARELRSRLYGLLTPDESDQKIAVGEPQSPTLEMAHVLFTDIVEYSLLPMDKQRSVMSQFQQVMRGTSEFIRSDGLGRLIRLPTGDGIALVFFEDLEAPVRCAIEISRALRQHPEIKLRIGLHTGPVYRVADINANLNVAGGGINVAQRVMDCGDAGHILLSKSVVDMLIQLSGWANCFVDLGQVQVKHGMWVHLFNFCAQDAGNPDIPPKLRRDVPSDFEELNRDLDKGVDANSSHKEPIIKSRILEAAAPKQSSVGRATEILAVIRLPDSEALRKYINEEKVDLFTADDLRQKLFRLSFPRGANGKPQPAEIFLKLESPNFQPQSQTKKLKVPPRHDSEICTFLVTPLLSGELLLNLELFVGDQMVVSRSIRTRAEIEGTAITAEQVAIVAWLPLIMFVDGYNDDAVPHMQPQTVKDRPIINHEDPSKNMDICAAQSTPIPRMRSPKRKNLTSIAAVVGVAAVIIVAILLPVHRQLGVLAPINVPGDNEMTVDLEISGIRGLLDRLSAAFSQKSIPKLKETWPTIGVDQKIIESEFRSARKITRTFEVKTLTLSPDKQMAMVGGIYHETILSDGTMRKRYGGFSLRLAKNNNEWLIKEAQFDQALNVM